MEQNERTEKPEHKSTIKQWAEKPGFARRMTREEINRCPIRRYDGQVCVISSIDELIQAAENLNKETILGFDTETRPAFRKGKKYYPALIQLAGREAVYLFHLTHIGFPQMLIDILGNPRIIKTGVAVNNDILNLRELSPFKHAGFVDLGDIARNRGIKNHGLRGLAAVFLGFRISKQAQVSNWARKTLTREQIKYAATDAWVSRELYLRFEEHFEKKLMPVL